MRIRPAVGTDVPWLLSQLRAFASAYPVPLPLYGGDEYTRGILERLLASDAESLLAIAERDTGAPVGFLGASVLPHPLCPDLTMATEWWWWVQPADRGSRAGLMLLATFEQWADALGVPAHLTTEATSALNDRHLTRRGYAPVERHWLRMPAAPAVS